MVIAPPTRYFFGENHHGKWETTAQRWLGKNGTIHGKIIKSQCWAFNHGILTPTVYTFWGSQFIDLKCQFSQEGGWVGIASTQDLQDTSWLNFVGEWLCL
jgi:hypothetical protein